MTTPAPVKLHNIQSLRGIAALLVVFSHLPSMEVKHGGDIILPAFMRFGISGVDLFFVISGFIMVYVTWESRRSLRNSAKFLFARFTRIYPIYWLIAFAVLLIWLWKPSLVSFDPEKTSILKSFLLWPDETLPMLKVAWTLVHEVYFYIVFALLLLLPRRLLLPGLCFWVCLILIGQHFGLDTGSPEAKLIFHPLSLEFFMGAAVCFVFKLSKGQGARVMLAAGLLLWGTAFFHLITNFDAAFYPSNWQRVLYFGLPAMLIVYGLAGFDLCGKHLPKWSERLGDWSYSLYLSHVLVLSVLGYIWRAFAGEGPVDNVIALSVMTLGCIAASAVIWYVFENPMQRYFRALRMKLFPSG